MLVNLRYYEKFDKPVFGDKTSTKEEVVTKALRHAMDIHDDYTPLSLNPTDETSVCTPLVDGWNFINKSLENGLTVYNFHPKIRESKVYLYPDKSAEELERQLSWINNIVAYAPTCVFFWNTENYSDLKYVKLQKPIKKLYAVAASFKPNMILNTFGFDEDTEVVFQIPDTLDNNKEYYIRTREHDGNVFGLYSPINKVTIEGLNISNSKTAELYDLTNIYNAINRGLIAYGLYPKAPIAIKRFKDTIASQTISEMRNSIDALLDSHKAIAGESFIIEYEWEELSDIVTKNILQELIDILKMM
jgi:hypothetical protein